MHAWWLIPLVLCAVALTVALVAAVLALRRALQRLELVLAVLERQLGPTLEEVRGLTQEAHAVTHDARTGVARLSATIDRVNHLTESLGSFLVGVSGFTRAGQLIGMALGVRKGIDVFVERLRRPHGRKHHG